MKKVFFIFAFSLFSTQVLSIENRWPEVVAIGKVTNAYKAVLQREADKNGLDIYSKKLIRGQMTVREVILELATSDEFAKNFVNKSSPDQAIIFMYKTFLSRPPENQAAIDAKARKIGHHGWRYVIEQIFDSEEYLLKNGDNMVPIPYIEPKK